MVQFAIAEPLVAKADRYRIRSAFALRFEHPMQGVRHPVNRRPRTPQAKQLLALLRGHERKAPYTFRWIAIESCLYEPGQQGNEAIQVRFHFVGRVAQRVRIKVDPHILVVQAIVDREAEIADWSVGEVVRDHAASGKRHVIIERHDVDENAVERPIDTADIAANICDPITLTPHCLAQVAGGALSEFGERRVRLDRKVDRRHVRQHADQPRGTRAKPAGD
ncbi:hypothetical protein ES703_91539 [subsurface metagenome]